MSVRVPLASIAEANYGTALLQQAKKAQLGKKSESHATASPRKREQKLGLEKQVLIFTILHQGPSQMN